MAKRAVAWSAEECRVMSEDRIYDLAFTRTIARDEGNLKSKKESRRFEIYNAGQFKLRLDGKNFSHSVPARRSDREDFYRIMFRLRIDGKWYNPRGRKYTFFSLGDISELFLQGFR